MTMKLAEFFKKLEAFEDAIPMQCLKEAMCELQIKPEDIVESSRFNSEKYQRNLLTRTPNFEALLLCFEPNQETPIHDHSGSACSVMVIEGTATEVSYKMATTGRLVELGTSDLPAGGVVSSQDNDIHSLGNTQAGERLITLHVYSPPLGIVGNYSRQDHSKKLVTAATRND